MFGRDKNFEQLRAEMVQFQLRGRGIRDERVLSVMAELPRELFLPADQRAAAYDDRAMPIGLGQTISQPYVVALMTAELDVREGHRVLEIGTGSGYQTAILARLAGKVYSIERVAELAESAGRLLERLGIRNVTLRVSDGTLGWAEEAPFDRILCGAGSPSLPPSWAEQLAEGGRMVLPVGGAEYQQLIRAEKHRGALTQRALCDVRFVPLIGEQGWEGPGD